MSLVLLRNFANCFNCDFHADCYIYSHLNQDIDPNEYCYVFAHSHPDLYPHCNCYFDASHTACPRLFQCDLHLRW